MHVAADALYLKDWKCVEEEKIDTLIFSAISFGQTEFALEVEQVCKKLSQNLKKEITAASQGQ